MTEKIIDLKLSRRKLLQVSAVGAAAAGTGVYGSSLLAAQKQIEELKAQGWTAHPVACTMCGAYCGLLALTKDGQPTDEKSVRVLPNPGHPQQGYCGRAAQAMWVWNHPLRLRKPLKRVGERGSGKFQEVSWDEALDGIAKKLKEIVNKYGERSVVATSHTYTGFSKWLPFTIGSPNNISHSSTCNSAGIAGRDWVFGKGFSGAGKLEPDYANLRYLILIGRSMGSSMGALHTLNQARERGAKVVAVDPRMPDIAYGDAQWVPIKPGTDSAFVLSLMNTIIQEGLADLSFIAKHTNGAYLIKADGKPLTQADFEEKGSASLYAVRDKNSGKIVFQGVKNNEKGAAVGFIESPDTVQDLDFAGEVTLPNGKVVQCQTAFKILKDLAAQYPAEKASEITGIAPEQIVRIARDFANFKGAIDDGWYTSKNGTDVESYQLICIANALIGNIDRKGGLVVTQGAGFKVPSISHGKGPNGAKWEVSKDKRIDKIVYPESAGTYAAALEAAMTGKPYPVKASFIVGTTLFHREANSDRLAKGLAAQELVVVQDLMPHEVMDHADYVLPSTYFLERKDMGGVKWARDGSIYLSDPGLNPPKGCDARHDVWILLEIARRAFPERAERMGYKECKTAEEFAKYYDALTDKGFNSFLKQQETAKPGSAARISSDIKEKGWSTIKMKAYDVYPYKKPFGTPTGKVEIYGFKSFAKPGYDAIKPITGYVPSPAYSAPDPQKNQFVLVSGKNCNSCSGLCIFTPPSEFIGDRTLWMNPADAARLGISNGQSVEVSGVDNPYKAVCKVTVTKKVIPGSVFAHSFSGAVRTKNLNDPRFQFVKEGINSHWYATGYAQPIIGNLANNSCVAIKPF